MPYIYNGKRCNLQKLKIDYENSTTYGKTPEATEQQSASSPEPGGKSKTDWPKCVRPLLLLASCLIVPIRKAKWPPRRPAPFANAIWRRRSPLRCKTAHRIFMHLIAKYERIFPQKKEPWYRDANAEDVRK
jgi:hypothetical protein